MFKRMTTILVILAFISGGVILPSSLHAQSVLNLPQPGTMVAASPAYHPAIMTGMTIYPDDPLRFDFLIDVGDDRITGDVLEKESGRLINYFLAALTIPEDEMWVNLSPYEKDRIIAEGLSRTEMGRDMLAQDYILKQLTASLMYPEDHFGGEFWKRVHAKAREQFGTTEIPTNTFNKIWIVPETAAVSVNETSVFVVESHLKVMLEEDYLALESNAGSTKHGLGRITKDELEVISGVSAQIVREILIPEIEREVNEGKNFANLRQIYHSMILAAWYKKNLNRSLLGQIFSGQNKTNGIDVRDKEITGKIYDQYVEAFQKGVYNYIREDYDAVTQEMIPRKYFSGGEDFNQLGKKVDVLDGLSPARADQPHAVVSTDINMLSRDGSQAHSSPIKRRDFLRWGVMATGLGVAASIIGPADIIKTIGGKSGDSDVQPLDQEGVREAFLKTQLGQNIKVAESNYNEAPSLGAHESRAGLTKSLSALLLAMPGLEMTKDELARAYSEVPSVGAHETEIGQTKAILMLAFTVPFMKMDRITSAYDEAPSLGAHETEVGRTKALMALASLIPFMTMEKVKTAYAEVPSFGAHETEVGQTKALLVLLSAIPGMDIEKAKLAYRQASHFGVQRSERGRTKAILALASVAPDMDMDKAKEAYDEAPSLGVHESEIGRTKALLVLASAAPNMDMEKVRLAYNEVKSDGANDLEVGMTKAFKVLAAAQGLSSSPILYSEAAAAGSLIKNPGGIDLNPDNLELQERGDQIDLNGPAIDLNNMPSHITINGIQPVIINVTPLPTLYPLLGLKEEEEKELIRL